MVGHVKNISSIYRFGVRPNKPDICTFESEQDIAIDQAMATAQLALDEIGSPGASTFYYFSSYVGAASVSAPVPLGVTIIQTGGYTSEGDGGGGYYVRRLSMPGHPLYLHMSDGSYWELVGPIVHVAQAGAIGNNVNNDIVAFQACAKAISVWGGGKVFFGGAGKIYRIAFTSDNPALVFGSNSVFENIGFDCNIRIDASLQPVIGSVGPQAAYGEITTGDPSTLKRAGRYSTGLASLNGDGFTYSVDPTTMVTAVWFVRVRVYSNPGEMAPAASPTNGATLWFANKSGMIDCAASALPCNGLAIHGGWDNTMVRPFGDSCGFGGGFARNGISMTGYTIKNSGNTAEQNEALSSHRLLVDGPRADFNHDEGIQFANIKGLIIRSPVGRGNLDKFIEGDIAYATTDTASSLGMEIPNELIISDVIYDGLYSDGSTLGKWCIAVANGNQGRVSIRGVRARNIAGNSPVLVSFNDNGRVSVDDVTIEDCTVDPNFHFIRVEAEQVRISGVTVISPACSSNSNQAIVSVVGARLAVVDNIQADSGAVLAVVFGGSNDADDIQVNNFRQSGCVLSAVQYSMTGHVKNFTVSNCDFRDINGGNDSASGFVKFDGNPDLDYFSCYKNRASYANAPEHPIITNASGGSITSANISNNELGNPLLIFSPGVFDVGSIAVADLRQYDNGIPGQRIGIGSGPPGSGTWKNGDQVIGNGPVAGSNIGWVCTTSGTPGTWKTFGAIGS